MVEAGEICGGEGAFAGKNGGPRGEVLIGGEKEERRPEECGGAGGGWPWWGGGVQVVKCGHHF